MEEKKINLTVPPSLRDLTTKGRAEMKQLVSDYMNFIDQCRTPHESCCAAIELSELEGIGPVPKKRSSFEASRGFYMHDKDFTQFALVLPGWVSSIDYGMSILGAHIDSPCLNIRSASPIMKAAEGVVLAAMPYGGIWPYQWLDTQVSIRGLVPGQKENASKVVKLEGMLSDRGIHPAYAKIASQKVSEAFPHEMLKVVMGYATKADFLKRLTKDGIIEEDFFRGTWWVVPQASPTLLGGNIIAGYGHDDRICFFAQLMAAFKAQKRTYPLIVYGCSREEIGSTGINGAKGAFIETVIDTMLWAKGYPYKEITEAFKRQIYSESMMVSSDVDVAYTGYDAEFQNEDMAAKLGNGIVMVKANGGSSQSGGNRASDRLASDLLDIFRESKVVYQITEMPSKLQNGGGGTIAMYFAQRGIPVIDAGPPVGNMHGKMPIAHVGDLYQTYKAYRAFIERSGRTH